MSCRYYKYLVQILPRSILQQSFYRKICIILQETFSGVVIGLTLFASSALETGTSYGGSPDRLQLTAIHVMLDKNSLGSCAVL
ncbi:hypothetical protein ASPZODRAFT_135793 [Penicilliopsis zonata CBS 506.65]|uniref:Uncharacterized protein n=1 Tax=Penicilliopsis zonata CBS 506.65 TaxID=1073090 RepID=A0A1L9S9C9_9EURO|nr:hypothetical protein ASPZODRAFT_135793 [Penicilliopsis zonata CBS 506.65]OJJ43771.1 hypothetical protein ASPZODRAFT_135793 [Penicilliopsis zonata CBS 506.65]